MKNIYQYPLKIDKDLMEKLKVLSEKEGRSVNKQIEFLIRQFVNSYPCSDNSVKSTSNGSSL